MGFGPIIEEVFDAAPGGSLGPIVPETFDALASGSSGPVIAEQFDAFGNGLGPVILDLYEVMSPASGPLDDHVAESVPTAVSGPPGDHLAEEAPSFATGPISDAITATINQDAAGTIVDWTLVEIPDPFVPIDPASVETSETKVLRPLNVRCSGSGGDGSPGVCGRSTE